jgi:hypothetical protein
MRLHQLTWLLLLAGCAAEAMPPTTEPSCELPPPPSPSCYRDHDCATDQACLDMACVEGTCIGTPRPAGPAPGLWQTPGGCRTVMCEGKGLATVAYPRCDVARQ